MVFIFNFRFEKKEFNMNYLEHFKPHEPRHLLLDRVKTPNDTLNSAIDKEI